jgi:putative DNA primase/helicase
VTDIADRMQCPPDFPAVSAMVALSSVIGRKACIAPKRRDNWRVIPNLWGAVVGRPGVMKSPALAEAMKPLDRLQAVASDLHAEAMRDYSIKQKLEGMGGKATEDTAQKLVKAGKLEEAQHLLTEAADFEAARPPALRRYVVTDASVEALGEILIENPWGVLAYRDELNGLLRGLDKEGRKARGLLPTRLRRKPGIYLRPHRAWAESAHSRRLPVPAGRHPAGQAASLHP